MRKKRKFEADEEVNVTPLLDIVFIMLIFFIVTSTFGKESGLKINRADAQQSNAPPSDSQNRSIVLEIDGQGRVFIEDRQVDIDAVRPNVERLLAERPKGTVIVRPGRTTPTRALVNVMDQAQLAGAANVVVSPGS